MAGLLIAVLPLLAQSNSNQQNAYTGPIIDMHLHSYTSADFWGPAPNPVTGKLSVASAEQHLEETLKMMRRYNVVLGAVSGVSEQSGNEWHSKAPGMFLRGIELREPAEFMDEEAFRSNIQNGTLDMLGEVGAQYFGYSPSEQGYYPYYKIAEEEGIPVGIHTGASFPGTPFRCCPNFRLALGNPMLLEDMLIEFPKLKVFMMHAGGAGPFSEYALMMLNMYPQLYTDISILNWMPGMEPVLESFLQKAKQMGVLDRIFFGTDQMVWHDAIGIAIERVNSLDFLTAEEKADLFYNNAARFLGLSEAEINKHQQLVKK
ncbi:amidohydrolase family protein [Planktosalinus lacus]|uniref:Metal-dependent hydrolase n=1 Tax=Planktosalinus lacus TaxID=1526573 RepID=A0A8J2VB50_9FLAO|nr:amidohydrolase family protein [Planktosalinus lacus]GGD95135.1 metal-dependent hydrolase [Planktosalinus lacus]